MKKTLISAAIISTVLVGCKDQKKKTTTEVVEKTKIELQEVEKSLDDISTDVKKKSEELDKALNALENL